MQRVPGAILLLDHGGVHRGVQHVVVFVQIGSDVRHIVSHSKSNYDDMNVSKVQSGLWWGQPFKGPTAQNLRNHS
jgi:hypothetical protein